MRTITLSNEVMVSDPCYTVPTWCQHKLTNVLPGEYQTKVVKYDDPMWGNRCSFIIAVHKDHNTEDKLNWRKVVADIGVDSGQAGIFCESSYRNDGIVENIKTPVSDFHIVFDGEGEKWYEAMCKFTLSGEGHWGSYDSGVVTSSGYGDGGYPLEVLRESNGYIVGMKITYLFPEDEEEDEEWDDQDS